MLTFDEATHTYRWNGQRVPSVTSLLRPIHDWSKVPPEILRAAQARGTYVHRMTELYDLGELDEERNAQVAGGLYVGYLRAWKAFLTDFSPTWGEIEKMDYSRLGYAGTWDRWGQLNGRYTGRWLVDIKTGAEASRAWGVQMAAYRQIRMEADPSSATDGRATVQLASDGTYEFVPWTDPDDWACFRGLLDVYKWSAKE